MEYRPAASVLGGAPRPYAAGDQNPHHQKEKQDQVNASLKKASSQHGTGTHVEIVGEPMRSLHALTQSSVGRLQSKRAVGGVFPGSRLDGGQAFAPLHKSPVRTASLSSKSAPNRTSDWSEALSVMPVFPDRGRTRTGISQLEEVEARSRNGKQYPEKQVAPPPKSTAKLSGCSRQEIVHSAWPCSASEPPAPAAANSATILTPKSTALDCFLREQDQVDTSQGSIPSNATGSLTEMGGGQHQMGIGRRGNRVGALEEDNVVVSAGPSSEPPSMSRTNYIQAPSSIHHPENVPADRHRRPSLPSFTGQCPTAKWASSRLDPSVQQSVDEVELNGFLPVSPPELKKAKRRCREIRKEVHALESNISRLGIGNKTEAEKMLSQMWQLSKKYSEAQRSVLEHDLAVLKNAVVEGLMKRTEVGELQAELSSLMQTHKRTLDALEGYSQAADEMKATISERESDLEKLKEELGRVKEELNVAPDEKDRQIAYLSKQLDRKVGEMEAMKSRGILQSRGRLSPRTADAHSDSAVDTTYENGASKTHSLTRQVELLTHALEDEQAKKQTLEVAAETLRLRVETLESEEQFLKSTAATEEKSATDRLEGLQKDLTAAENRLVESLKNLEVAKRESAKHLRNLADTKTNEEKLKREVDSLKGKLADLSQAERVSARHTRELEEALKSLEGDVKHAEARSLRAEKKCEDLESELRQAADQSRSALHEADQVRLSLVQKLEDTVSRSVSLEGQLQTKEAMLEGLQTELDNLRKSKLCLETEIQARDAGLMSDVLRHKEEVSKLELLLEEKGGLLVEARANHEKEAADLRSRLSQLENSCQALNLRHADLTQQLDDGSKAMEGKQNMMERSPDADGAGHPESCSCLEQDLRSRIEALQKEPGGRSAKTESLINDCEELISAKRAAEEKADLSGIETGELGNVKRRDSPQHSLFDVPKRSEEMPQNHVRLDRELSTETKTLQDQLEEDHSRISPSSPPDASSDAPRKYELSLKSAGPPLSREFALERELECVLEREKRLEEELGGVSKEFERLSLICKDSDEERRKLETMLSSQKEELISLRGKVQEKEINSMMGNNVDDLREEFQRMMSFEREKSTQRLQEADAEIHELEHRLRKAKRDREGELYAMQTTSTQTSVLYSH